MKLLPLVPALRDARGVFGTFDDFDHYVTADDFSTIANDGGGCSVSDAVGGILTIDPSDGSGVDNDQSWLKGTKEIFKFADDKPMTFEAMIQYAEAATSAANIAAGFWNAVADDDLADNGGGVRSNFFGCVIYKVDGGTVWKFTSSMGTTQSTSTSTTTAGGSAYQRLRIEVECPTATEIVCTPTVDGAPLIDATSGLPIQHRLTISSATEMQIGIGCKCGGASEESLKVDYVACFQAR